MGARYEGARHLRLLRYAGRSLAHRSPTCTPLLGRPRALPATGGRRWWRSRSLGPGRRRGCSCRSTLPYTLDLVLHAVDRRPARLEVGGLRATCPARCAFALAEPVRTAAPGCDLRPGGQRVDAALARGVRAVAPVATARCCGPATPSAACRMRSASGCVDAASLRRWDCVGSRDAWLSSDRRLSDLLDHRSRWRDGRCSTLRATACSTTGPRARQASMELMSP